MRRRRLVVGLIGDVGGEVVDVVGGEVEGGITELLVLEVEVEVVEAMVVEVMEGRATAVVALPMEEEEDTAVVAEAMGGQVEDGGKTITLRHAQDYASLSHSLSPPMPYLLMPSRLDSTLAYHDSPYQKQENKKQKKLFSLVDDDEAPVID